MQLIYHNTVRQKKRKYIKNPEKIKLNKNEIENFLYKVYMCIKYL